MNLLGIRQKFIELSGRYDLATTTSQQWDTDNGADFFINAGGRWLDLKQENAKSIAQHDVNLSVGDYKVDLEKCRVIVSVWIKDSNSERVELIRKSYGWIRSNYPKLGNEDNGTPKYWCPFVSRYDPSQVGQGVNIKYVSLMFMPPTDEALTLEVFGIFHSLELSNNSDENYWSVNYPDLLVLSSLRILEGFYRNTQGVLDYERQIDELLIGIDKDVAEDTTIEGLKMEG